MPPNIAACHRRCCTERPSEGRSSHRGRPRVAPPSARLRITHERTREAISEELGAPFGSRSPQTVLKAAALPSTHVRKHPPQMRSRQHHSAKTHGCPPMFATLAVILAVTTLRGAARHRFDMVWSPWPRITRVSSSDARRFWRASCNSMSPRPDRSRLALWWFPSVRWSPKHSTHVVCQRRPEAVCVPGLGFAG